MRSVSCHVADNLWLICTATLVQSYGWIVHGLARENRLKDAIMMVREMKGKGLECPERFAFLLRERFKVRAQTFASPSRLLSTPCTLN